MRDLRAGESAETRAAAARMLAGAGSQRATPHLIAALFDADATVRTTANEVLAQLGNSTVPSNATAEGFPKQAAKAGPATKEPKTKAESVRLRAPKAAEQSRPQPMKAEAKPVSAEPVSARDPQQLLGEENEVRTKLKELETQVLDTIAARKEAEKKSGGVLNAKQN